MIIRHGYAKQRRNGSTRAYRKNRAIVLANATVCSLCGEGPRDNDPFVSHHIIPHSIGGPDTATNLAPAHESCNREHSNL